MTLFTRLIDKENSSIQIKWKQEASDANLVWIEKTRNNYSLYMHTICGHQQEIANSNVRKKQFKCDNCFFDKRQSFLNKVDLVFVKNTKPNYALFLHKKCGHQSELQLANIKNNLFGCKQCRTEKFEHEAELQGLTFVKHLVENDCLYLHNACGNYEKIKNSSVRKGIWRCSRCFENKLKHEADKVNLTYIKKTKNNYALYSHKDCNTEQEINIDGVRRNMFCCTFCEESWATKKSNLYIHLIDYKDEKFVKIGIARDVGKRAKQYGLPDGANFITVLVIPFPSGRLAKELETKILRKFKKYKNERAELVMKKSGKTECFIVEKMNEIVEFASASILE
jgi:hypothetical protein